MHASVARSILASLGIAFYVVLVATSKSVASSDYCSHRSLTSYDYPYGRSINQVGGRSKIKTAGGGPGRRPEAGGRSY
eukprot:scaffold619122_cov31-Prasinocladus_malaysianus.AAC.1